MGIRGPLGNWYPWKEMEGKNVVIIGGGFAFTTLRSSIIYMLHPENRPKFSRTSPWSTAQGVPGMLLYKDELAEWEQREMISRCISRWTEPMIPTGSIISVLFPQSRKRRSRAPKNAVAIVCGPPIMIKFTPAGPGKAWIPARKDHPFPGNAHEMRYRHLRPLQHRGPVRMQGRPGLSAGQTQNHAGRVLDLFKKRPNHKAPQDIWSFGRFYFWDSRKGAKPQRKD